MGWSRTALLIIALAASPVGEAKGIFQAHGQIAEVRRNGTELTFRFAGDISFGYASARDNDPRRRWHDMDFERIEVVVRVAADASSVDRIQQALVGLMKSGRSVQFSIDNPTLGFSNRGELVRVSGTNFYGR